eukprot:COSAG01_NODE_17297_length_1162_cov_2.544685_2_plen_44_part_01
MGEVGLYDGWLVIRTTISPDTDGSNSCHERTMHGNSLRLSGYAS